MHNFSNVYENHIEIGLPHQVSASGRSWFYKKSPKPDITAYLNDFAVNKMDKFERAVSIKNVYNHPSYYTDNGAPRNDISLLETNEDLYGTGIQGNAAPACIPPKGYFIILKSCAVFWEIRTTVQCTAYTDKMYTHIYNSDTTTESMQQLNCFVAGFGTVEWEGAASDFLKSIHVNIISDDVCRSAYYGVYDERVEFCAGKFKSYH